ncbi:MAG TPA: hypothetical protein VMR45_02360 [Patescibacteria group bacterium]|nr:hypothetical protein [Patescibacteria group bacterium]
MDHTQKVKLFRQSIIDYISILALWIGFFMVSPLAFVGSTSVICHGLGSTCTTVDTTRWYWLGGYHVLFGPEGPHYPAVIKYWPTSTWEMWLAVFISLSMAIIIYVVILKVISFRRRRCTAK